MHRETTGPRQVEGLDLFHAIYAIILAFGIQEAASALYSGLPVWSSIGKSFDVVVAHLLIGFAILLLVIRFFGRLRIYGALVSACNGLPRHFRAWSC